MGLVSKIGRTSPRARALRWGIFLVLSVGAVAMVVPFLLMLSGATRSGVDRHSFSLVPEFLRDDEALYRKYIEGLYNESPSRLRAAWGTEHVAFDRVRLLPRVDRARVEAWESFLEERGVPSHERFTGFTHTPESRGRPWNVRRFMHRIHARHGGSIEAANEALGTAFRDWNAFRVLPADTRSRLGLYPDTAWWRAWEAFAAEVPSWSGGVYHLSGFYRERVVNPLQEGEEEEDAEEEVEGEVPALTARAPEGAKEREWWELFLREVVHPGFIRVDADRTEAWRSYLEARYVELETYRNVTGHFLADWADLELPRQVHEAGPLASDWLDWLQGWRDPVSGELFEAPLEALRLDSADLAWRARHGRAPPLREWTQVQFEEHRGAIRRMFLLQNFGTVWEILILHGRGLWVTVVYCAGSVAIALVVNPLAAYALSRFRPRHSYALLLYLLLTMAFPPMVTQIPLFLMLRDLHLLNTFWALLFPGMAHGYSIFLLKGFFDSLPRDLYESAALDGAGEMRMFVTITLSLSRPILAVIALFAFVNAYTAFMFALLICQDERMWTLMVWLYQMQQTYGAGVMNAAFVLAALPTLTVFLFAQRQILKGIVIPTEK